MKRLGLALLFVAALAFGLALKLPLAFAMKQSGVASSGVQWQQARGTIWDGQITGLSFAGVALGGVQLKTYPREALTKGIASRVNWRARSGSATAHVRPARGQLSLINLRANIALSELPTLRPELRRTGATLNLTDAAFTISNDGRCLAASGNADLDLVQRLGQLGNRAWPMLRGSPECHHGGFTLPLSGTSAAGEAFNVTLIWSKGGQPEANVKISGLDPQAMLALKALGFVKSGNQMTLGQGAVLAQEK